MKMMTPDRRKLRKQPSSVPAAVFVVLIVMVGFKASSDAFILPSFSPIFPSSSSSSCAMKKPFNDSCLRMHRAYYRFNTDARTRGRIRYHTSRIPTTTESLLLVSLESPYSATALPSSDVATFLCEGDHPPIDSRPIQMEAFNPPLVEMPEQCNNNTDFNHQGREHENGIEIMPDHSASDDELENLEKNLSQAIFPFVSISYDEHGVVQADATTTLITPDSLVAAIQNPQHQEEGADYPAIIKSLFRKDATGQTLASKLFNLALLAASFGFVFVSVFNIDRGMTRGWSPAEIGMRIPLDTWASYENSLSEKPVATKTIINIVIYLLGDWLSQTLFQRKDVLDFDAARTLKNGLVGMCFGPAVHEYYEFSDWILPVDGLTLGITNRAFKILMDQTIYLAVKCSIYIVAVGLLNGESVENGTENVKNRLKPIMFTAWKFWPLVHCVTYGLIPARHRILWVNSVDLVWNAILASKARGDDLTNKTEVAMDELELNEFEQDVSVVIEDSLQAEANDETRVSADDGSKSNECVEFNSSSVTSDAR